MPLCELNLLGTRFRLTDAVVEAMAVACPLLQSLSSLAGALYHQQLQQPQEAPNEKKQGEEQDNQRIEGLTDVGMQKLVTGCPEVIHFLDCCCQLSNHSCFFSSFYGIFHCVFQFLPIFPKQ